MPVIWDFSDSGPFDELWFAGAPLEELYYGPSFVWPPPMPSPDPFNPDTNPQPLTRRSIVWEPVNQGVSVGGVFMDQGMYLEVNNQVVDCAAVGITVYGDDDTVPASWLMNDPTTLCYKAIHRVEFRAPATGWPWPKGTHIRMRLANFGPNFSDPASTDQLFGDYVVQ